MRETLQSEAAQTKLTDEQRTQLNKTTRAALTWLDGNPNASKDDIEKKHNEVASVCDPVLACLPPPAPAASEAGLSARGPLVEEVD